MCGGPEISPRRGKQLNCSHVGIPILNALENQAPVRRPLCAPMVRLMTMSHPANAGLPVTIHPANPLDTWPQRRGAQTERRLPEPEKMSMLQRFNSSKTDTPCVSQVIQMFIGTKHGQQGACAVKPDLQLPKAVQLLYMSWKWCPFSHGTWKAFQPHLAKGFKLPVMENGWIIPHPRFLHRPYLSFLLCQPWFSPTESFRKWFQGSNSFVDIISTLKPVRLRSELAVWTPRVQGQG